ncbi:hypothetical protein RJT34_24167 [Clitoria ternatea]|uniref:Secreted protein n=1 Tax=Clitoria ternatea TaxID=43366 RepID=A0AAN9FMD2_CLITE
MSICLSVLPHCLCVCWSTLAARLAPAETNNAIVGAGAEARFFLLFFPLFFSSLVLTSSSHLINLSHQFICIFFQMSNHVSLHTVQSFSVL